MKGGDLRQAGMDDIKKAFATNFTNFTKRIIGMGNFVSASGLRT